jgi:hypothetical protein
MNVPKAFVSLVFAAAMLTASPAFAAGSTTQKITLLNLVGSASVPYTVLLFDEAVSGSPACAVQTGAMAIDTSTVRGKAQLSLVTAAFLAGKMVSLTGTGSCVTPAGFPYATETVLYVGILQ